MLLGVSGAWWFITPLGHMVPLCTPYILADIVFEIDKGMYSHTLRTPHTNGARSAESPNQSQLILKGLRIKVSFSGGLSSFSEHQWSSLISGSNKSRGFLPDKFFVNYQLPPAPRQYGPQYQRPVTPPGLVGSWDPTPVSLSLIDHRPALSVVERPIARCVMCNANTG